jgi:Uncharacterized proteins of the AP superfamily
MENFKRLDQFILPSYDGNSIVNLSNSLLNHFGIDEVNPPLRKNLELNSKIVLIVIDGLGMNVLKNTLSSFTNLFELKIDSLTSTFPSTTSTAITSLLTGKEPGEHGIIGYISYIKELGGLTNILRYSHPLSGERDMFKEFLDLAQIAKGESIIKKVKDKGFKTKIIIPKEIANSALSRLTHGGSEAYEYINHWDAIISLKKAVENNSDLVYAYFPQVDTLSHVYGYRSEETYIALRDLLSLMNHYIGLLRGKASFIITADHGHIEVGKVHKVLDDKELMSILSLPPFGDSRAIFLKSESDIRSYFSEKYSNFKVFTKEEALKLSIFGKLDKDFIDRIGDYIAIPFDNSVMIYPFKKKRISCLKDNTAVC